MVPATKSEAWPWGIYALIIFAALLVAFMAVLLVARQCSGKTQAADAVCPPEQATLLQQPVMQSPMQYAPQQQMQYVPQQHMQYAPQCGGYAPMHH